jgi:hypothetical protein
MVVMNKAYSETYYLNIYETHRTAGTIDAAKADIVLNATNVILATG